MKNLSLKTLTIALTLLFSACEKKDPQPEAEPEQATEQKAADVLNANSGYSSVYDYIKNVQGVNNLMGSLNLADFTVDNNNTLHFVRNSGQQLQQSYQITNQRVSVNLSTKDEVPQPAYTSSFKAILDAAATTEVKAVYKPYSNYASVFQSYTSCVGDISASGGNSNYNFASQDFDFFYPQFNLGKVDNASPLSQLTYIFAGLQNPPSDLFNGCTAQTYSFTNPSPNQVILGGMFDWKRTTAAVKVHAFLLRNDSMLVYNCNTATIQKITAVPVSGLSPNNTVNFFRSYNSVGSVVGLVFKESGSNKYWTFSYNFSTQVLTKGLDNSSLEYSATGSDVDADEFGNLYYSGIAGNGSNTNGVSIYKKDVSGSSSLVGADNFLKFGTITKLKCLAGKVYLVVAGTISNTYYKQLTFLKQN